MENENFNCFSSEMVFKKLNLSKDLDFKNVHQLLHLRKMECNKIFIGPSDSNKFKGTPGIDSLVFGAFTSKSILKNSFEFLSLSQMKQIY
jgi:hypothetical protein